MKRLLLCALLVLQCCHDKEPPAPTPEQSAELNDASAMLNNIGNEEGPEANAPGPSNSSD